MPEYIRVRWKATGHQSTIPKHRFDPGRHAELKRPAVGRGGDPLPPKYKTPVAPSAAGSKAADDGHQATEPKETN